ncbi:MAG: dihydroxy-acid dehydratase, partial [Halioglobus sp.]
IEIDIPRRSVNVALSAGELAARRRAMEAKGDAAWRPAAVRPRKVTPALKVYAKMVTSADKGAVRDLSLLD